MLDVAESAISGRWNFLIWIMSMDMIGDIWTTERMFRTTQQQKYSANAWQ